VAAVRLLGRRLKTAETKQPAEAQPA